METPKHQITLLLLQGCNFASVTNPNVNSLFSGGLKPPLGDLMRELFEPLQGTSSHRLRTPALVGETGLLSDCGSVDTCAAEFRSVQSQLG